MPADMDDALIDILRRYIRDTEASWSCGSFGAVAEFARDPDEAAIISENGLSIVTARGGMRLAVVDGVRAIAYELPGRHPDTWQHGLALCLPEDNCRLAGRAALTELGPDAKALRPDDREAILFDLGLAIGGADICVRTADPKIAPTALVIPAEWSSGLTSRRTGSARGSSPISNSRGSGRRQQRPRQLIRGTECQPTSCGCCC